MSVHEKDEQFRQFSLSAHPLRFLRTPEDLITVGAGYFRLQMLTLIVSFFNTVYIATGICAALVVIPVLRQIRRLSEEYEGEGSRT